MKHTIKLTALLLALGIGFTSCNQSPSKKDSTKIPVSGEQIAELTHPPFVPAPIGNRGATKLKVSLEILELEGEMVDGVTYNYWTFGGTVPGQFIRVRLGDEVEFVLKNHPDNKLPHNIDLHAVTGPGGGAESSLVAPGEEVTFSFKCLNPGLFVYHCATAPVGMHIANGMYGLILVEPEGGLPPVDREYYVMQGDFYTEGGYGEKGFQAFDMNKAIQEHADYVVFNGNVNALVNENALQANVGETVRLFVGNGGPNLVSSFHVIGEIFDRVHVEGGSLINENVQTTLIPAGGAAIVEFKVEVPGTLVLVDHSIFRAFNKGALGMINVEGEENHQIYSGRIMDGIYLPEGGTIQQMPRSSRKADVIIDKTPEQSIADGKAIFARTCLACHQPEGQGIESIFPPLAQSDYLNNNVEASIDAVLFGLKGEITVNGAKYNSIMPSQALSDQEVSDVLNYVYNSWGNNKTIIKPEDVTKRRNL